MNDIPDIAKLRAEAAGIIGCEVDQVEWYSWPQAFGSTAGPRGGAGGMTITTFQVFGFDGPNGRVMWCAGVWKPWSPSVEGMRW